MATSRDRSRSNPREHTRVSSPDEWTLINKGKNGYGGAIINIIQRGSRPPRTLLISDDYAYNPTVTFEIDSSLQKREIKPEFLSNPNTTKKEFMDINLTIHDENMQNLFHALDHKAVRTIYDNQKKIWGDKSDRSFDSIQLMYQPFLRIDDNYLPTLRARLYLTGPSFLKSCMRIYQTTGNNNKDVSFYEGDGWEFLSSNWNTQKLKGYRCVASLCFRGLKVWPMNSKVGVSVDIEQIWFYPGKPKEIQSKGALSWESLRQFTDMNTNESSKIGPEEVEPILI